jgi:hypothetical protein
MIVGRWLKMPEALRERLSEADRILRIVPLAWLRSACSGRRLRREGGPPRLPPGAGLVAIVPYYGNERLLPAFLAHHRRLGVDFFVFLDLAAPGDLWPRLGPAADCVAWRPDVAPDPRRVLCWLNYLRWRYASGRWCLSIEASELIVFFHSETRGLKDLIEFVDSERRDHVFALVVEMYGELPAERLHLADGEHPLESLPYYDQSGYVTAAGGRFGGVRTRGGLQRRALFAGAPGRAPALDRLALVRWRWFYAYVAGTQRLALRRLNSPHGRWHSSPTAALLSFALLDDEPSLAAESKAAGGELVPEGGGSLVAGRGELRRRDLKRESSARYAASVDLLDCGLLHAGQWF